MLRHNIVTIYDLKKIKQQLIEEYDKVFENPRYKQYMAKRNGYIRKIKSCTTPRGKNFNSIQLNKLNMAMWQPFYCLYITAFRMLYAEHGELTKEEIAYLNDFYEFLSSFKLY